MRLPDLFRIRHKQLRVTEAFLPPESQRLCALNIANAT
jgi:hypothetical protein